jgi:hypothetical protein
MSYDPRAVKLPKSIKRTAAAYIDPHKRGAYIKSFVKMLEGERDKARPSKSK